jgi:histone demethylase
MQVDGNESDDESDWSPDDDDDDEQNQDDTLPYGSSSLSALHARNRVDKQPKQLNPPAPSVILENKKDAFSPSLEYFCLSHPISVVRGLAHVLRLDLSLFSTKTLVDTDPGHVVEIRSQRQQASDENWDAHGKRKVWRCDSQSSCTTLLKYAQYQAHSFQEAVRDEKLSMSTSSSANNNSISKLLSTKTEPSAPSPSLNASPRAKKAFKTIKFGTNVDLSDEVKWKPQLQELAKLPPFMRVVSAGNMLTHVGYKIDGVNALQMYLKVPGCRTPGHQENNAFCSLNINIGPGDCEWFGVDEKYWTLIEELCERHNVDFLNGSWWPSLDDLHAATIPVYRFLQKPGDLVWVNAGCVHWVQSTGWCNNVSWNIGPLVYAQYKSAIERYEWNRLRFYKSIVPMIHLSWNIARNLKITDRRLYEYVRYVLMQSLKQCQLSINYVENCGCELKYQSRAPDEPAHYCYDCDGEVFNVLFVSELSEPKKSTSDKSATLAQHVVHCQACARKRNHLLDNYVILHQYSMDELKLIYDQFQLYIPSLLGVLNSLNSEAAAAAAATGSAAGGAMSSTSAGSASSQVTFY